MLILLAPPCWFPYFHIPIDFLCSRERVFQRAKDGVAFGHFPPLRSAAAALPQVQECMPGRVTLLSTAEKSGAGS